MIIFGFRTYVRTLAMVTLVCGRCRYTTAHRLTERIRKFTLFFIPLFPLSTSRTMTCTYCGQTGQVDAATAQRFAAAVGPSPQRRRDWQQPAQPSAPAPAMR